jgi:hypothetical protein
MKLEVVVCDVCQTHGRPVTHYTVIQDAREKELDLCERHAAPLEVLLGENMAPLRHKQPRRSRTAEVVTLEEIEAQKQKP